MQIKIIILDDNINYQLGKLKSLLEQEDYEVIFSENVPHFKQLVTECVKANEQLLILSDINLMGFNEGVDGGVLAIEDLAAKGISVPTIFMTNYGDSPENNIYARAKKLSPFFLGENDMKNAQQLCEKIEHATEWYYVSNPNAIKPIRYSDRFLYSAETGRKQYILQLSDVCYWKADKECSYLHTNTGLKIMRSLTVGKIWEQIKDFSPFLQRLGSGPIVNVHNIDYYQEGFLYFRGKEVEALIISHERWTRLSQTILTIKN